MLRQKPELNTIYISERMRHSLQPVARSSLTAVVAPMGYGKTTAVEWYLAERARADRRDAFRYNDFCKRGAALEGFCSYPRRRLRKHKACEARAAVERALADTDFPRNSARFKRNACKGDTTLKGVSADGIRFVVGINGQEIGKNYFFESGTARKGIVSYG